MTCSNFPLWKSCNFLSVNYYELISDAFEEYISEALIPEANFLNKENSLHTIDESYRTFWKREYFDSEFLCSESKKIDDSLSTFCSEEFNLPEPFSCFYFKDLVTDFVDKFPLEKNVVGDFNDYDFTEECKILYIPPIPFTLMSHIPNFPPLSKLLEKLPIMEIEDVFEEEIEFPMEDINMHL